MRNNFNSTNGSFNGTTISNSIINMGNTTEGDLNNNNITNISSSTKNFNIKISAKLVPSVTIGSISALTISNYFGIFDFFSLDGLTLITGIVILVAFLTELRRKRFQWLGFFGLRLNKDDVLQFINLKDICSICGSKMNFKNLDKNDLSRVHAQCSRFPKDHSCSFDPTILDSVE